MRNWKNAPGRSRRSAICLRQGLAVLLSTAILAGPVGEQSAAQQAVRPPTDIISDNLDRVAAGAEQILEVLKKDSGMMVELKRLLAQDAGAHGQLVEESDLTDGAIAERLYRDVRVRTLATRFLQRYGYLLPGLNPDSDLAAEHKLTLQQRAQELGRASERSEAPRAPAAPERTSGPCDPRAEPHCALPGPSVVPAPLEAAPSPAPQLQKSDGGAAELRAEAATPATETLLAAARSGSGTARGAGSPLMDGVLAAPSEALVASGGSDRIFSPQIVPSEANPPAHGPASAEFEPVRMVRRPNPYADVPALYDLYTQAAANGKPAEPFGLDVFRKGAPQLGYLPMDLPVGPDYVVGPGDGLSIDLWGGVSQRFFRTVDREGRVALPETGPLLVAGRTLGEVQDAMQRALRTQFRDVSADVSLLRLRTVRVYVVGEVATPGAYDVSSLSTPLNALFTAGGVTPRGSLRRLEHFRGKQLLEQVDAYDLLLRGVRGGMQRLENGDSLRVPPVGPLVTVDGMVRRPAIYELREERNLEDALDLAGGILPAAALRHIEVQRLVAHEKRTMLSLDIGEASDAEAIRRQMRGFAVQDGDEVHIFPIAPYNTAAVYLEGHVLRPGRYSYREGMKLTDLVGSYKDLLPEPAGQYAEIIRLRAPDYRPVVEAVPLAAALEHPESAPKLEALDTVRIFGRFDFEPAPEVMVTGEVRAPGRYRTSGQQHVRDAIYQAGGAMPDAWLDAAQLFRLQADGTTKVFSIRLGEALNGNALENLLLQPRDRILVHRQPLMVDPPSVCVRGDVARPGRYPLATNMRASDLVRTAGGLLRSANPENGDLMHYAQAGSTARGEVPGGHLTVDLSAALNGSESEDPALRDGDVLTVPQRAGWKDIGATVTLTGEVRNPGAYGIQPGERVSTLLRRAGGLLPTAYQPATVLERPEVRELQEKSRQDLIRRLEQESTLVKSNATTTGAEEAALQAAALQQRQRTIEALRSAPVSGRMVVRLRYGEKKFENSPEDILLRPGDALTVPKQPGFVLVMGQVYNANAIAYTPGKNAGWYLSRAGGATGLADKGAIFILRASGSVTSGREGGWWSGGVLSSGIGPGDVIIVPEKPVLGGNGWKNFLAIAQIAQAGALAAAVAIR